MTMPAPPNSIPVPAVQVQAAARALWGDQWQSAMAKALGIDLRRVQRIAAAARDDQVYPIPRGLLADLLGHLDRKSRPLQRAYEDLKLIYDGS